METFHLIDDFYQSNHFNPRPIQLTANFEQSFKDDAEFAKRFSVIDDIDLKKLLAASIYLQMPTLTEFIYKRIAFEFYVDKNNFKHSMKGLKERFPNVKEITAQEEKQYF